MRLAKSKASFFVGSLLFLFIIWLIYSYLLNPHTKYLTYIQESVSGLSVGSRVEYNGVEVGVVKRIKLNTDNPKLVKVVISVDASTPVTAGTVAMLSMNAGKGAPFIALADDGNSMQPLVAETASGYRVIPSVPSTKANPNTSLTQLAASIKQFNDTFQSFMSKDEVESFKQLLYSMQEVMGVLAENSKRMGRLIVNTEKASNQFGSFLSSGQNTLHTVETVMLPSTSRLINRMDLMLNKMSVVVSDMSQNPSVILRGKAAPVPGPGE